MMFTLEQARKYKGLTQAQAAKVIGVAERTYIKCENYEKILDMKQALLFSQATGIDMDQLIFFKGQLQKFCTKEAAMR